VDGYVSLAFMFIVMVIKLSNYCSDNTGGNTEVVWEFEDGSWEERCWHTTAAA